MTDMDFVFVERVVFEVERKLKKEKKANNEKIKYYAALRSFSRLPKNEGFTYALPDGLNQIRRANKTNFQLLG
jgi:hypothetical protein